MEDVQRHRHNRAVVELDDGRRAFVYPSAPLEIVQPAQEPTPLPAAAGPARGEPEREPDIGEGVAAHEQRWTSPLAASTPLELVARWETTDQLPRALALYDALGQLHVSASPEQKVAQLWLADPQAAIVVQTWEQAAEVRRANAEAQVSRGAAATAPLVLLAEPAYRTRLDAERTSQPSLAPERAYVLAELEDHDALTGALSVAMRSHLVIRPPDQLTADLQAVHAREIAAVLEAAEAGADVGPDASASRSLELAIEAGLQAEAQRQAEREAGDREAALGSR